MPSNTALQISQRRMLLACLGAGAGLVLWQLAENWDNPDLPPSLYLALLSFCGSYATLALALVGPVQARRALPGALLLALPFAGLVSLAGRRYDVALDVLEHPILVSVSMLLLVISTPFLSVSLQDRQSWRDYAALFETAWALTIRYLLAWVFVGLFWLLMFLSDTLLTLVDIDILDRVMDIEWLVSALTGGVLGLAMAVIYELRTSVSPFLLLRLLRLLVVPVVVVVAIFLTAIPMRGISQVFGDFSAAATLMSVAMVMITLVAVVLERDDARMRKSFTITQATRLMVLLLPLVTGLAAWSIWLRVSDYGWTPDRVLAACVGGVLVAYGMLYALAVLRGTLWAAYIRRSNVALAMGMIAISMALLSPVLNVDRISANSQLSRYLDGRLALEELPLWDMQHEWGQAGQAAIVALENSPKGQSLDLIERLVKLRATDNRWVFARDLQQDDPEAVMAQIVDQTQVRPVGQMLTVEDLEGLTMSDLTPWLKGCQISQSEDRTGCILILDQFDPTEARQGLLIYASPRRNRTATTHHLVMDSQKGTRMGPTTVLNGDHLTKAAFGSILNGDFTVGLSSYRTLHVGGVEIMPLP
ncbi:DUF4153 domain-containing protein [Parasedimentitalea marina]|uniref:DUF4153 domain-containing protein n=1 Tax=Parasedimentitalea marina TaxID=2483033 RepID=A0A3T0N0B0_9RHOB|nr:DUF4153 domain-containing protein [Parasedimentitalea marina]AZV77429.1 DUF4153 domain-containing protein [Parasedimentitalea marina]